MVVTKRLNLDNIFLFLFLVIFPFGQIIRLGILQPIDVVVGCGAIWAVIKNFPRPTLFKYFEYFLLTAFFSWILSVFIFRQLEVLYGFLYLLRISAYFYFLIYVVNFAVKVKNSYELLIQALLSISIVSGIFGWIQYFVFPSIKPFFVWGWDEHLFRLVGTFLDPGFLGLIIVLGALISMYRYMNSRSRADIVITVFLLLSLAFTYSRGSYLAFFAGLFWLLALTKRLRYFLLIALGFFVVMLILPTARNHILSFTREFSVAARLDNYKTVLAVFEKSPVFGVGYDNMCIAYKLYTASGVPGSHACSGSDSSLLFILATTGVVGFVAFIYLGVKISMNIGKPPLFLVISASLIALLVHSLFNNSIFYPWVMGYMIILLALNLRGEVKS